MLLTRFVKQSIGGLLNPAQSLRHIDVELHMQWVELDPVTGLPSGYGIYVDPNDPLIGRTISTHRFYEQHIAIAIRSLLPSDGVFLDIGANIGFHTLVAADHVGPTGKVIAIEMSPINCTLLRATLKRNGMETVTLHPCAVAEEAGWLTFCVTPKSGNGMLVNDYLKGRLESEPEFYADETPVRTMRVDRLVPGSQKVDVIKMDIEGSELRALRGMTKFLARQRPYILFEFHPNMLRDIGGTAETDILDFLRGYGYRIHQIMNDGTFEGPELTNQDALALTTRPDGLPDLKDLIAKPQAAA